MAQILFVTWDGGGNLPPAIGIAQELKRRGHAVRFLGHRVQAQLLADHGLQFAPYDTAREFSSRTPSSLTSQLAVFGDRSMGSDVLAEITHRPTDVVVVDCLLFGVMDALRRAGRSYVVLEHSFDGFFRRAAKGPLGLALRLRGFRPLSLIDAGDPTLALTLPQLDDGHGAVTHTGPVLHLPEPVAHPAPEATILVSLSTFAFRSLPATWQRVLDAVAELPVKVIATTGPAVDPADLRVTGNVELHRWLPHSQVLPQVSMVLGHGGHATTMLALAHDLPLVVVPVDAKTDQPFVGRAVERAGAGRVLSRRSSPALIRAAVEEVLADGPQRQAAARLGQAIRAMPGALNAADRIESLVDRRPGRGAGRAL